MYIIFKYQKLPTEPHSMLMKFQLMADSLRTGVTTIEQSAAWLSTHPMELHTMDLHTFEFEM